MILGDMAYCLHKDSVLDAKFTLSPMAVGSILVSVPKMPIKVLPVLIPKSKEGCRNRCTYSCRGRVKPRIVHII